MTRLPCVLLAALAALLVAAPSASAVFPGRNGLLATWGTCSYSNYCTGPKIGFVTPHGHGAEELDPQDCRNGYGDGSVDCDDTNPAWSPDGRRLAFVRDATVYVAGRDGSQLHAVTAAYAVSGGRPAWSPDGRRLVFQHGTGLSIIDATGGAPVEIVSDGSGPAWSSDDRIAFQKGASRHENLFSVHPNGSHLQRLTRRGGSDADWSPHASRLAFTRGSNVWTVRADGTHARRLIGRTSGAPIWSPDGHAIAFEGAYGFEDTPSLYVARLDRLSRPWNIGTSEAFDWQSLH